METNRNNTLQTRYCQDETEKPRVFLVGGGGFIGRNLVSALIYRYKVTVFDKYIDENFYSRYPQVDLCRIDLVEERIPVSFDSPDFIINLASIVSAERDLSLFSSLISTNLQILLNLYERFKDSDRLKLMIQFGSSEEYGNITSPYKETDREHPGSPYALIKQLTTNTAIMLHDNYGFRIMVVRPGNLYGPGQPETKFIPYVTAKLRANEPLQVSPCEQKRDFIHVAEFCKHLLQLMERYELCVGQIINISSGTSTSLKRIIETLKAEMGSTSEINYGALPYRENEAMDLCCDVTKLKAIITQRRL